VPAGEATKLVAYQALRDEAVHRLDADHQLLTLVLALSGGLLSVALTQRQPLLLLFYPIAESLLVLVYANSTFRLAQIGEYLATLEAAGLELGPLGWEGFRAHDQQRTDSRLSAVKSGGVGVGLFHATSVVVFLVLAWSSDLGATPGHVAVTLIGALAAVLVLLALFAAVLRFHEADRVARRLSPQRARP